MFRDKILLLKHFTFCKVLFLYPKLQILTVPKSLN
nr:MAG TPA: hypothetical protein [Caudoviricetes sp.]